MIRDIYRYLAAVVLCSLFSSSTKKRANGVVSVAVSDEFSTAVNLTLLKGSL